jgi:hypothetical protein
MIYRAEVHLATGLRPTEVRRPAKSGSLDDSFCLILRALDSEDDGFSTNRIHEQAVGD